MARLVVKRHRPLKVYLFVLLLSVAVSGLSWFLLNIHHWHLIKARLHQNKEAGQLWQARQRLAKENTALREKLILLERSGQIDAATAAGLQNEILELQDQVYRLKDETGILRGDYGGRRGRQGA